MRDDICTIPVSEIFEVNDGCPLCRMHDTVEERIIKYILGDAMMEPDVRMDTNAVGFCADHYDKMFRYGNRLQLALMLKTHTEEIINTVIKTSKKPEKKAKDAADINDGCFVCRKIDWGFTRMIDTVYRCYEKEEDFRKLFNAQPQFCFKHYEMLLKGINKRSMRNHGEEMAENLNRITLSYAEKLYGDVSKFCSMYDYHNVGNNDFGESRDSVERILKFLTMGQK